MTGAQRAALDNLWRDYGVDLATAPLDLSALFGRTAPRVLEIGFGMGDALAEMARAHPEQDFLGIEVHRPGVGNLLRLLAEQQVSNVRVICADAVEVLGRYLPDAALDAVHLFFPDPWPKRRHHKRRIVQPPFVALVANKLKRGGRFHLCTDWEDYATQMLEVLDAAPEFTNACPADRYATRGARPLSKFERRATREGREVWDLVFLVH
ncbi:MAG: tRNA (guanosine(46)-N7)-methyltransferase TrmB [Gammaproteobacteria bacterium]|nr:tRNA (guanosine(46)-N7)-methyltransferase TrmB [Gammaproteobacteria bacterium]